MGKHQVQRPRHLGQVERVDEQTRVADLSSPSAAHEAPKLLFGGPFPPRSLFLQGAERSKVPLDLDDLLHPRGAEGADQLVLQVLDAHVETECLHRGSGEVGAQSGSLQSSLEVALLACVAQTGEPDVEPFGAESAQEPSNRLRTADGHDGDTLCVEIPATARRERFERALVADSFDEDDRLHSPYLRESSDGCVQPVDPDGCAAEHIRALLLAEVVERLHEQVEDLAILRCEQAHGPVRAKHASLRAYRIGRAIYAIGGNLEAARAAGIKVDRVRIGVFAVAGVISALAGLMIAGQVVAVTANQGNNLIFTVFAAP